MISTSGWLPKRRWRAYGPAVAVSSTIKVTSPHRPECDLAHPSAGVILKSPAKPWPLLGIPDGLFGRWIQLQDNTIPAREGMVRVKRGSGQGIVGVEYAKMRMALGAPLRWSTYSPAISSPWPRRTSAGHRPGSPG